MTLINTVAQSASNEIRSHSHPVLETGNLSFPDGRYSVDFRPGDDRSSFFLEHRVEGAPLVSRLLKEKRAQYICIVSSPISSYRKTYTSEEATQEVRWDREYLGEPPLFTPMILCTVPTMLILSHDKDGVHNMWDGAQIALEKGSRLALGPVIHLRSSFLQLLLFKKNKELDPGTFFVDVETEPFRFLVNLHPDLHRFLRSSDRTGVRTNIMTHIVTACFALLQREFSADDEEQGWKTHRDLRTLATLLEEKNLPCWDDPDLGGFRPEEVATKLHPHILPSEDDDDET